MDNKEMIKLTSEYDNSNYYLRLTASEIRLLKWLYDNYFLMDYIRIENIVEEPKIIEF